LQPQRCSAPAGSQAALFQDLRSHDEKRAKSEEQMVLETDTPFYAYEEKMGSGRFFKRSAPVTPNPSLYTNSASPAAEHWISQNLHCQRQANLVSFGDADPANAMWYDLLWSEL